MAQRPLGVTLVAIIAWLSGFLQSLASIIIIFTTLFVGVGLWRGNSTARTIATIVFVANIVLELLGMFNGESLWSALAGAILSIIGLILLYTRRAREYFGA